MNCRPFYHFLALACFFITPAAQAFNCKQIQQFTELYLKVHYSANAFDDELSKRTLDNFLKSLDPAKMYFLQEDIDGFRAKYESSLDEFIERMDCRCLNEILHTYSSRFKAQQPKITELIAAEHDFTIDEHYDIDRQTRVYAATEEAMQERWRKQIKLELLRLNNRFDDIEQAREKLLKRYELSNKYLYELDGMELASIFLNAYSTALDPHSKYLSQETLEDFHISTGLSLEGIGAVLRSEYGLTTVQSLVPGGPAQRSGQLREGDTIIAVGQADDEPIDVVDMKLREVVRYIRGNRGTEVRLTIEREEKDKIVQKVVTIIRDKIELTDKEARGFSYEVQIKPKSGETHETLTIGLIRLPSFYTDFEARKTGKKDYKSSVVDIRRIINDLTSADKTLDALIIDLRFNSGGSLDEAIQIAGLFFDEGPVVQVHNAYGNTEVLSDTDGDTLYAGPLTLLINRQSASSSEILAGALQDYGRGLVVGDSHSFGKGTVQTVKDIAGGQYGAIKATISKFFLPAGHSTQLKGIDSDIVLPDMVDELELGEKFYDYHLPWDAIEPADFQANDQVSAYLAPLKQASELRIATDPDFIKIKQDIVEYHEKKATRSLVSLQATNDEAPAQEEDTLTAKEEDEDEINIDGPDESRIRPKLDEDPMLRETLAITTDYVRLLNDQPLGTVHFPELADIVVAESETAPKNVKNEPEL